MSVGVSAAFEAAYTSSHTVVGAGTITAGAGGADSAVVPTLYFDPGNSNEVTVDVTAANRRSCTVTLVDVDGTLLPLDASSPLSPIVNELQLWRGIQFDDGSQELVPLGLFGIQSAQVVSTPAGPGIVVSGIDRSKRLDQLLGAPFHVTAGNNYGTVIDTLVSKIGFSFPTVYDSIVTGTTCPLLTYHTGDNIWEKISDIAASLGCWAYFDVIGQLNVVPIPFSVGDPAWTYAEGTDCVFDNTDRVLALEDGSQRSYSHAIVSAQPNQNSAPLRADAYDTDPSSPTYYLGPFGDRPIVADSQVGNLITTQSQCQSAANALLTRNFGILERVHFSAAPNPALDGGDALSITDSSTGTDNVYSLESFNIPMFAQGGMMSATMRTRQVLT